jgi:hypothetical protein
MQGCPILAVLLYGRCSIFFPQHPRGHVTAKTRNNYMPCFVFYPQKRLLFAKNENQQRWAYKGYNKRSYNSFLKQVFEGYPVQTNLGKLVLRSLIAIDTFHRMER